MTTVKGAKAGQEKARKPSIAADSASSTSTTKILYGLSEGEISGLADGAKSIRLDGTPLLDNEGQPNFEGVTWDFREGTNEQGYIQGFPDVSNETPISVELRSETPWIRSISDTQLSAIRVRFRWDRLSQTDDENGDVKGYKIEYAIDLKTDDTAYREVLNTKIEDKTSAGYERTHRIDLPRATSGWQIRIRRITPNSTSEYIADKMYIDAIAEVIDVKLAYPNTALLGLQYNAEMFSRIAKLEVDAIGKIVRVPSNYNSVNRTYSGVWNGTFKDAYSNNPAWVYYDLVTQWRYGLGERLDATMIDKWSLYALGQYCDESVSDGQGALEPRFTCNVYLQKQEDAYKVLQNLAGIFRAMSYWNGEKIILDADVPQDPVYTFSVANVVGGNFEYTGTRQRDRHTLVKVAWDNPNNSYQTEYEYVRDEESMAKFGVKPLDLSAFGCTSQAQAQRAGLWALKTEQLETRQVAFSVGLDGFIPQVGNIINISDDLFAGRALSGRVSTINSTQRIIELDRDVVAANGDVLVINGGSGKSERRNISNVVGNRITVTAGFISAEPEHIWAIETADLKLIRFRVMQITQNDDNTFGIVGIQHEPSKYDGIDTGTDIKYQGNGSNGNQATQPTDKIDAPTGVTVSPRYRIEQGLSITTVVIQWLQVSNAVTYDVEIKKDSEAWRPLPRTRSNYTELDNAYAGTYTARVRAISPFGVQSASTESLPTVIANKLGVPTAPLSLSVYGILFGMQLNWAFGTGSANTAFTEIEQATDPLNEATISPQGTYAYPTDNVTINGLGTDVYVSYRARLIDKFGNAGEWTTWVEGQSSSDAQAALDLLSGQISKTQLAQDMVTAIDKIDVNANAISAETQARIDDILAANATITAERTARINAIQQSALQQQDNLQDTADALAGDINTVALAQSLTDSDLALVLEFIEAIEIENGVQAQTLDYLSSEIKLDYTNANKFTSVARGTVWTFAKAVAHADYVNSESIRALSADYQNSSAKFSERINLNTTANQAVAEQVTTLSAQLVGGYDGNDVTQVASGLIYQERTATATRFEGLAEQISLISAGVGEQFDPLKIWHFDDSSEGWVLGTYATGWLKVQTETITSPTFEATGNTYRHVKFRVQRIGTPTWDGMVTWTGGSKSIPLPDFNIDDIAVIDIDTEWTGSITSFGLKLASSADVDNYYSIDWIAVGRPSPAASSAALSREEQTRANQVMALTQSNLALDSKINTKVSQLSTAITQNMQTLTTEQQAQATLITSLDSKFTSDVSNLSSNITDINNTLTTEQQAQANRINIIDATVANNKAEFISDINAVATEIEANATLVESLTTVVGDNDTRYSSAINVLTTDVTSLGESTSQLASTVANNTGLIQQESQTRADEFGSMAQQITTVQSTAVDADDRSKTNKTSIQQNAYAMNGLFAQYTLKVDVNGRISGFGLASTNTVSAFNIRADQFYISNPNDPNYKDVGFIYESGSKLDPETGQVTPQGLYLKAAFIKEASITTAKIRGQAVTIMASVYQQVTSGSSTPIYSYTTPSLYLNSGGSQVLVRINMFSFDTKGQVTVTFLKDGGDPRVFTFSKNGWGMGSLTENVEFIINGSYANSNYQVRIESQGNGFLCAAYTFTATVLKR